jgi:C1A family cysteine protease
MPMTTEEHDALWEAVRASKANWRPGHNSITDLDESERRFRLGYTPGPDDPSLKDREARSAERAMMKGVLTAEVAEAPAKVDWRNVNGKNFVTGIKDQGSCNSCVAFAAAATIESRVRIILGVPVNAPNGGTLPDLSEAHLFYCGNTSNDPCLKGWFPLAALTFATNTGVVPASCFPYTPGNQPCNRCDDWQMKTTKIATSKILTSVPDMKAWLAEKGPLITCFTVYSDFIAYTGGVYVSTTTQIEGGHCVSCVGYDDAKQAWLCKNSWGTGWGEGGYVWIGYGQVGIDAMMWGVDSFAKFFPSLPRHHAVAPV